MIELIEDLPDATIGLRFSAEVSGADYDAVLVPAIDAALDQHARIKALLVFDETFEGYTLEAAWDDTRLGLRHWDGFERIAVVSDVPWLRHALRAISVVLPCPVRLFGGDESDQARRWLGEALGTIHLDSDADTVSMAMIGRLDPDAYQRIDDDLANLISRHDPLRLFLDLRQFEGWQGLGALGQHLCLIRDYRSLPRRVAVVGAHRWQQAAQRLLARFVNAQTRYFDSDHVSEAKAWLVAAG
jgi:hypothetical protein